MLIFVEEIYNYMNFPKWDYFLEKLYVQWSQSSGITLDAKPS